MIHDRRSAAPTRSRPSARTEQRLREALRRDVADTRVRLHEAQLRGDALVEAGRPHEAALVVDEQRALVAALRVRVEDVVASAAVEREAEWVVEGATATDAHPVAGARPLAPADPAPRLPPSRRPMAAAGGVILAAVLAAAALLVVPDGAGRTLAGTGGTGPPQAEGGLRPTVGGLTTGAATFGTGPDGVGPAWGPWTTPATPTTTLSSGAVDGLGRWFGRGSDGTPDEPVTPPPELSDVIDRALASAALEGYSLTALDGHGIQATTPDRRPEGETAADTGSAPDGGAASSEPETPAPEDTTTTAPAPTEPAPAPSEQPAADEATTDDDDAGGEGDSTPLEDESELTSDLETGDVVDGLGTS